MKHSHAIVWMDSKEARIFSFNADDVQSEHIKAHSPHHHVHRHTKTADTAYFHDIAAAVQGTKSPDFIKRMTELGYNIMGTTSAEMASMNQTEINRWGPIVKASGAKVD